LRRGIHNIDEHRHAIERIPPARYLDSSYYERWLDAIETMAIEKGLVSREEIVARGAEPSTLAPTAKSPVKNAASRTRARFRAGDGVIGRNINPRGHTRLPRYVRGKRGTVMCDWGLFVTPDLNAHGVPRILQHVYNVRFEGRELWGPGAPHNDELRIDLWEDYLDPDSRAPKPRARKAMKRGGRKTIRKGARSARRKR
jgi:nitrile hydratase subunit beta